MKRNRYMAWFVVLLAGVCQIATSRPSGYDRSTDYLEQVLFDAKKRKQVGQFLDEVLLQVNAHDFFNVVDTVAHTRQGRTDQDLYQLLLPRVIKLKPTLSVYYLVKSISAQREQIAVQARELLNGKKILDGCVEIGTPGTYMASLQAYFKCTGTIYGVYDEEKLNDYFGSYSTLFRQFLSCDTHIPLNDFQPLPRASIADGTVDLVLCFVGFHHVPQEKLHAFLASVHRVLRPGGMLLLREHDVCDPERHAMVQVAHSICNMIILESMEEELQEYRNFKPLSAWIELLQAYGFNVDDERCFDDRDMTYTAMIRCVKCDKLVEPDVVPDSAIERSNDEASGSFVEPATSSVRCHANFYNFFLEKFYIVL